MVNQAVVKRPVTAGTEVRADQLRVIRCPNCGFHLLDVYGYDHCYVRVKCRKCKFNEMIDTALFRTAKQRKRPGSCRDALAEPQR